MRFLRKTGLVLSLVLFTFAYAAGQKGNWQYNNYTIEDGLPNNNVISICQDSLEYMWIGTENGLSRFNGFTFRNYTYVAGDTSSLPGNSINKLFIDSRKRLLIGTSGGLCIYDVYHDNFIRIHCSDKITVRDIAEDAQGNIWVSTEGRGILQFSAELKQLAHFSGNSSEGTLPGNYIWTLFADKDQLWLGTLEGRLYRLDTRTKKFYNIREYSIENGFISFIGKDSAGNLIVFGNNTWMTKLIPDRKDGHFEIKQFKNPGHFIYNMRKRNDGSFWLTHPSGILVYQSEDDEFHNLNKEPGFEDLNLTFGSSLVFIDKQGNIWMGGQNMGLYHFCNSYKQFFHNLDPVFQTSFVNSIVKDDNGNLVAGTNIGSIARKMKDSEMFSDYGTFNVFRQSGIITNTIYKIIHAGAGQYLIGTYRGLIIYNENTGILEHYYQGDGRQNSLVNSRVYDLLQTDKNTVWIATNGGGVYILNLPSRKFTNIYQSHEQEPVSGLVNNYCISLMKDHTGKIWIGTYNGLSMHDPATGSFRNFLPEPGVPGTLSHNWIYKIFEDSENNIWVGTYNGLNLFEPETGTFRQFNKEQGLHDNIINDIIEDNSKHIWISTAKGISKISMDNFSICSYGKEDGLKVLQFSRGASYKDERGYIHMGGKGGVLIFNPERIRLNPYPPPVKITALKLFNRIVTSKSNPDILPAEIINLTKVKIPYTEKVITLEFTAFNYINPSMNSFHYKLEGFDKEWQNSEHRREVTYTNLNPGEYVFRVRAANNDGVWNNRGAEIKLIITPPWWKTIIFRISMALLIAAAIVGFYFYKVNSLRKNKERLELLVIERTKEVEEKNQLLIVQKKMVISQAEKLKETNNKLILLNASKDKFFSLIAHDLKNPFNSLLGFSEMLSKEYSSISDIKRKQIADVIKTSAERIYILLENLLQWAGTQTGNVPYNPEVFDLCEIIESIHDLIKDQLEIKKDKLLKSYCEDNIVFADRNMISSVIRNLLGNAVKFTENGEITIEVKSNSHFQHVAIRDTGVGMTEDKLRNLFSIENVESTGGTRGEKGTGLGLLICKEFILRNGGEIFAESLPGKGTAFMFTIPKS